MVLLCYCVAVCNNAAINALMCACDKLVLTLTFSGGRAGINCVEISIEDSSKAGGCTLYNMCLHMCVCVCIQITMKTILS